MWAIFPEAAREFVYRYPMEFDIQKVDQLWFMGLVANGAVARGQGTSQASAAYREEAAA